jgi:hypothetical protein
MKDGPPPSVKGPVVADLEQQMGLILIMLHLIIPYLGMTIGMIDDPEMREGINDMGRGIIIPTGDIATAISDLERGSMITTEDIAIAINILEIEIAILIGYIATTTLIGDT